MFYFFLEQGNPTAFVVQCGSMMKGCFFILFMQAPGSDNGDAT